VTNIKHCHPHNQDFHLDIDINQDERSTIGCGCLVMCKFDDDSNLSIGALTQNVEQLLTHTPNPNALLTEVSEYWTAIHHMLLPETTPVEIEFHFC
jgi:hypothetical protein